MSTPAPEGASVPPRDGPLPAETPSRPPPGPDAANGRAAPGPFPAGQRYRVLRTHARGGLGEVFVAADDELGREVALKAIQPPHAQNPDSRRRFVLEAELTGRLEHPGVVPVYGLGQGDDGRLFYAMRLIDGETLDDAARRYHAGALPLPHPEEDAAGERRLQFRQLLQRFVTVCNTLAYAHSRGIVHRDVKPANVMLGKFGEVLVVDWGLAKALGTAEPAVAPPAGGTATAAHGSTRIGHALGTPAYMSPEQAAGRWDTLGPAADVYSLGATLYVLLTGQPPFPLGDPWSRVQLCIWRGDVPPPRSVKPDVPRPLEAVCRKAMALRPEDRYASALDLAADVEHWLADEPVSAYREPLTARARRWTRRHLTVVTAVAAALVVGVVSLAAATVLLTAANRREHEAGERERLAKQEAEEQRDRARYGFDRARKAVNESLTLIAEHPRLKQADFQAVRKELLTKAVPYYEEFAREEADDPRQQAERAHAYERLAYLRAETGEVELALADYRRTEATFIKLAADFPAEREHRHQLGRVLCQESTLLNALGRKGEAEAVGRRALAVNERVAAEGPGEGQYRTVLAASLTALGVLLMDQGRPAEAEPYLRRGADLQVTVAGDPAADRDARLRAATALNELANVLADLHRASEAEPAYRRMLAALRTLHDADPRDPAVREKLAAGHNNLAVLLTELKKPDEAEAEYRRALAIEEPLAAEFPAVVEHRRELARTRNNLGALLMARDRPGEAENLFRAALAERLKLAQEFPAVQGYRHELALVHDNLGRVLARLGRQPEATAELRSALAIRRELAAQNPDAPNAALDLGDVYLHLGRLERDGGSLPAALPWYVQAVETYEAVRAKDDRQPRARQALGEAFEERARVLSRLGRHADALTDWDRAVTLAEGSEAVAARVGRALTLARLGEIGRATAEAAALGEAGELPGPVLLDLARVWARAAGDAARREESARKAVELLRRAKAAGQFADAAKVEALKQDADLAALRGRADYKMLLAELGRAKP